MSEPVSQAHAEARRSAIAGLRVAVEFEAQGIIPGLYGLRAGGRWAAWHPEAAVRLARVDALFGVTA